jgi:hypothetical protein
MSGVVFVVGKYLCCPRVFGFNPHKVPSFRVEGVREPICGECIETMNKKRAAMDPPMPPFEIDPDAYRPLPEGEL